MAKDDERSGGDRYRREARGDRYRREPSEEPEPTEEQEPADEPESPWRRFWRTRTYSKTVEVDADTGKGAGCGIAFMLVFLLFGLAFAVPFFLLPMWRALEARTWDPVPCTLERAWVESHAGDDGSTYSVGVVYLYEVGGRRYAGERYDFFIGSTSGRDRKQKIVDGLPVGTETTCWVDPDDPTSAVLSRTVGGDFTGALVVLPFVLAPLLIIVLLIGTRRRGLRKTKLEAEPDRSRGREVAAALTAGWLEPTTSPLGNLVSTTIGALLWNSIVGPISYFVYRDWDSGGSGCIVLFLVPFALVGLLLVAGVPYSFLALFNPRPRLALDPRRVAPGEPLEVRWRLRGLAGRIRRLKIELVATESTTISGSNGPRTREKVLVTLPVADTRERNEIGEGSRSVDLPRDAPETSAAVRWEVKLHGEIILWPDVLALFTLDVRRKRDPKRGGS